MTETDKKCEKVVFDALRAAFPAHAFIGAGIRLIACAGCTVVINSRHPGPVQTWRTFSRGTTTQQQDSGVA